MTLLAGLGKVRLHMVGISSVLIILGMARIAGRVRAVQVVISVHMTLRTLQGSMRAGERPPRAGMIERRPSPVGCVVALLAGLRKICLHMVGIGRVLEILQMARDATRIGNVVVVV